MRRTTRHASGVATAGVGLALLLAAPAGAADTPSSFGCRASVLSVSSPANAQFPVFEPLVAGSSDDAVACATAHAGMPAVNAPAGLPLAASAQGPIADTAATPPGGAPPNQRFRASAQTAAASLAFPGQPVVSASTVSAFAEASCAGGLTGGSNVVNLTIGGKPVPADGTIYQVSQALAGSPLGQVLRVETNRQLGDGVTGLTEQAVRVEVLPGSSGTPQVLGVLGEANVARRGDPCTPTAPGDQGPTSGSGSSSSSNGTNTNTNTNTQGPGQSSGTSPARTTGSSNKVVPIVLNGRNGGCGNVSMWFAKTADHGHTTGHPHTGHSRFGTRVVLRGRLLSCKGKPIVGARLDQIHEFAGRRMVKTGLKSRAGGALTLILPMDVATRKVTIAYRGDLASRKITSSAILRLHVRDRKGHELRVPPRRSGS